MEAELQKKPQNVQSIVFYIYVKRALSRQENEKWSKERGW